jgi:hypothetical protein
LLQNIKNTKILEKVFKVGGYLVQGIIIQATDDIDIIDPLGVQVESLDLLGHDKALCSTAIGEGDMQGEAIICTGDRTDNGQ